MPENINTNLLDTTGKSLSILNYVKQADANGVSTTEIRKEFGLAKSTVYAHLNTLGKRGYVVRKNSRYHVGLRCIELGEAAITRNPNYHFAENTVSELARETNAETEFLAEENGRLILLFHSAESIFNRQSEPYMYLHNTAAGKAILAEMTTDEVRGVIDQWGLPKETERTITNQQDLFDELDHIRDRGFAYNNEEWFEGYHGIGRAVGDIDGSTFGALTIGGPIYRISKQKLRNELSELLLREAEALERKMDERGISHLRQT